MKKIIRMISIFIVVILMFALPCFAIQYEQYSLYVTPGNKFSNAVNITNEQTINGSYSLRPLDIYNTYNLRIYYFLFSDASEITSINYRCDYDYSISSFTKVGNYAPNDLRLSLFYPYQSKGGSHYTFGSIFSNSGCNVYSFYVDIPRVNYQSIIGVTNYQDSYYRPDGSMVNQWELDKSIFSGFSVSENTHHYYIVPVHMEYLFNSEISIPYLPKNTSFPDDMDKMFVIHFNPSFMALCYGNTAIYNYSATSKRRPLVFDYQIYPFNSDTLYDYSFYNVSLRYDEEEYVDISPYSKNDSYRGYIKKASLTFFKTGGTAPTFSNFNYFIGSTGYVVPIPCDNDATLSIPKFYSGIYKSTSENFNSLPTYNFDNGNVNIDYSQYYLQKENWYDFGKDLYNSLIFLIFNIPLLNNLTAPLFMLLNNFIGVWSTLVLPLTTVGLVGAFFLFCFIYKTIKKLVGG